MTEQLRENIFSKRHITNEEDNYYVSNWYLLKTNFRYQKVKVDINTQKNAAEAY